MKIQSFEGKKRKKEKGRKNIKNQKPKVKAKSGIYKLSYPILLLLALWMFSVQVWGVIDASYPSVDVF
jgi:hypothetical protein